MSATFGSDEDLYQLAKHEGDIGCEGAAAEIRRLRAVVELDAERITELRRKLGVAPHDYQPARPGVDVD